MAKEKTPAWELTDRQFLMLPSREKIRAFRAVIDRKIQQPEAIIKEVVVEKVVTKEIPAELASTNDLESLLVRCCKAMTNAGMPMHAKVREWWEEHQEK